MYPQEFFLIVGLVVIPAVTMLYNYCVEKQRLKNHSEAIDEYIKKQESKSKVSLAPGVKKFRSRRFKEKIY